METTSTTAFAWSPDVVGFAPVDVIPDALPLLVGTLAGKVEGDAVMLRVPYVDDAEAGFVAEGELIPVADPKLDEAVIATGKIAQLVTISREQWEQDQTAARLSESVRRAVTKKANSAFLSQPAPAAPATTPPAGILNLPGIIEAGPVATTLDSIIDLMAQIGEAGGNPTHMVLSPTAWAELLKFKTGTDSNASLLGAGVGAAERTLFGLPVVISSAMPALTGLIVDSAAVLTAAGEVQVATSEHAMFTSDSIVLRATWRFGSTVVRPERVGTFTVTAA